MGFSRTAFLSFIFLLFANQVYASEQLPELVRPHYPGVPCQIQAAHIRNRAILAAQDGSVDMLALRLVQTLAARQSNCWEFLGLVLVGAGMFYFGRLEYSETSIPYVLLSIGSIFIGNYIRYNGTYNFIHTELSRVLPHETFEPLIQELLAMGYRTSKDRPRLIQILSNYGIDVSKLQSTLKT